MSRENHEFICIRCPRGCEVRFVIDEEGTLSEMEGNFCKLGDTYVRNELKAPVRTLTTTVRVRHGASPLVSVWTEEPVPKERVLELAELLRHITLEAPVQIGQVVMSDPLGLGIAVTASGNVEAETHSAAVGSNQTGPSPRPR